MRFIGRKHKAVFIRVKKGREKQQGIVVGANLNHWLLDPDSHNFAVKGERLFDSIISMTLAYQEKLPTARSSLLFEDYSGKLYKKIEPALTKAGYLTLVLDSTRAFRDIESFCSLLIDKPAAIFIEGDNLIPFLSLILSHLINEREDGKLSIPMTIFLSSVVAVNGAICIAAAQKRNITFVTNVEEEDLRWLAIAPYDVLIQGEGPTNSNEAVIHKRGFLPIAINIEVLV